MSTGDRRDRLFARALREVRPFEFDDSVAEVFADMISRSVPGYALLLRMIGLYADIFVTPGSRVYDLGCSLGDASRLIAAQTRDRDVRIVAVDNSAAMIEKCRAREADDAVIEWRCEDVRQTRLEKASMVIINLTLQFLPPQQRTGLLRAVFAALESGGVLVLSEKVLFEDPRENRRMLQLYEGFKKTMGYSDLEISQKRNALENVLIPDSDRRHLERLRGIGFDEVYQCFRGFNFVSYLAFKA